MKMPQSPRMHTSGHATKMRQIHRMEEKQILQATNTESRHDRFRMYSPEIYLPNFKFSFVDQLIVAW